MIIADIVSPPHPLKPSLLLKRYMNDEPTRASGGIISTFNTQGMGPNPIEKAVTNIRRLTWWRLDMIYDNKMPFNYQWKKANAIDSCLWDKDRCVTSLAFLSARLLQLEEDGNADHGDADEGVRDDEQDFSAKSLNDHCCEASASNLVFQYQYQNMDWFFVCLYLPGLLQSAWNSRMGQWNCQNSAKLFLL